MASSVTVSSTNIDFYEYFRRLVIKCLPILFQVSEQHS